MKSNYDMVDSGPGRGRGVYGTPDGTTTEIRNLQALPLVHTKIIVLILGVQDNSLTSQSPPPFYYATIVLRVDRTSFLSIVR